MGPTILPPRRQAGIAITCDVHAARAHGLELPGELSRAAGGNSVTVFTLNTARGAGVHDLARHRKLGQHSIRSNSLRTKILHTKILWVSSPKTLH